MILNDSQKWLLFVGLISLVWLIYLLAPVLTPFLAAALLAYLGDPLVDRLEQRRFSRTLSVSIVFVIIFILLTIMVLLLLPMLEHQLSYLLANIPRYIDFVQHDILPGLLNRLGIDETQFDLNVLKESLGKHWKQAGGLLMTVFSSITQSGLSIIAWAGNLVLIPVVTFYLLRDWDILVARIHELLPKQYEPVISQLALESDETLAAFLRGQFMVMLVLGLVYSTGLWIIDLKLALLIGMLAGMVSFVPYLGFIVGIVAASIAMLLQTQDAFQLVFVLIVFGFGQLLEGMLLTPLLVGDKIGLHPVAVIFAVLAGGQLFGFVGILLALPVAAVIAVLLRHLHGKYRASTFYENGSA